MCFISLAVSSPLTLDTNTAHPLLSISDDLRSVKRVKTRLPCAAHPERFDHWPQVLAAQSFSSGTHYWELEAEGFWDIGVCYRSIGRKGKEGNAFGNNKVTVWSSHGHVMFKTWSHFTLLNKWSLQSSVWATVHINILNHLVCLTQKSSLNKLSANFNKVGKRYEERMCVSIFFCFAILWVGSLIWAATVAAITPLQR